MSIFGTKSDYGLDVPAMEGYTVEGGDLVALEESMQDMLGVIEAIHTHDMAELECEKEIRYLQESYADADEIERVQEQYAAVMEGAVKDMYERLIEMLKKLLAKIKGYFKDMVRFFDGLIKSGKDFVKKYEKDLYALDLTGFEYKMFNWDNSKLSANTDVDGFPAKVQRVIDPFVTSAGNSTDGYVTKAKTLTEKKEEILDKVRGAFVGKGSVESSDYATELFAYFRNGAESKDDREERPVDIGKIVSILKEDKMVSKLKKAEGNVEKVFKDQIKELTKQRDQFNKKVADIGADKDAGRLFKAAANYSSKKITIFNEAQSIALSFVRAWKDAVVARNNEYKAVCVAAFRYKADK